MRLSITIIPIKIEDEDIKVLLQRRLNPREEDWIGMWEFPQGKIRDFDLVFSAEKELLDEAGMLLTDLFLGTKEYKGASNFNGSIYSIEPFSIVKVKEHLNFHFLALVSGKEGESKEANSHTWFSMEEIESVLLGDQVCPVNRPALEKLKIIGREKILESIDRVRTLHIQVSQPVVAVDVGGIITKWDDERFTGNLAEIYQCDSKDMHRFLIEEKRRHDLHAGKICHRELWELLNEQFMFVSYDSYLKCWERSVETIPHNFEVIEKLKEAFPDITFVIASNIDAITEKIITESFDLDKVFDFCFLSWRMGKSKPDKAFYEDIVTIYRNCKIMLIDDRASNLDAAQEAGLDIYEQQANANLDFEEIRKRLSLWVAEDR